jgi:hypothetical protein
MAWKFTCEDPQFQYWKVRKSDCLQNLQIFNWVTHFGKELPWYSYQHKQWVSTTTPDVLGVDGGTNALACRTFKGFVKHLNNHPELRTQGEIILCSRFVGWNVIAKWEVEE